MPDLAHGYNQRCKKNTTPNVICVQYERDVYFSYTSNDTNQKQISYELFTERCRVNPDSG